MAHHLRARSNDDTENPDREEIRDETEEDDEFEDDDDLDEEEENEDLGKNVRDQERGAAAGLDAGESTAAVRQPADEIVFDHRRDE
jgi:hypothetical protein